jgi:hypothetical protein
LCGRISASGVGLWGEIGVLFDGILSTTFIVSGLALIFGAFGAQATIQYKGWVVAGVAAIALAFLFAVDYLRRDSYVIVELLSKKNPSTTIKADNVLIKGTVEPMGDTLRTRFFVRYRDVGNRIPRFDVAIPRENASENVVESICFSKDNLVPWFGRGSHLIWWLNESSMEVFDQGRVRIGSKKDCGFSEPSPLVRLLDFGISSAHAQGAPDIETLLADLLSDNVDVRRLSRERLAD